MANHSGTKMQTCLDWTESVAFLWLRTPSHPSHPFPPSPSLSLPLTLPPSHSPSLSLPLLPPPLSSPRSLPPLGRSLSLSLPLPLPLPLSPSFALSLSLSLSPSPALAVALALALSLSLSYPPSSPVAPPSLPHLSSPPYSFLTAFSATSSPPLSCSTRLGCIITPS